MTELDEMESTPSPGSLADATVLILGGVGGIGGALATHLATAGTRVVVTSRSPERLDGFLGGLRHAQPTSGVEGRVLEDAADFAAVEGLLRELAERGARGDAPPLRGVVNAVGSILLKPAHLTSEREFQDTIRVNLTSAFALVRAAGRHLPEGGSVVLFSTAAVRMGLAAHEAIAAAKGGVEGLVRAAAATYAPRRVRVNAVAPGLVETPLSARIVGNEAGRTASLSLHALGRLGTAEEVARAAAFLLDPAQGWITGQVLGVDGGLSSVRSRG
jgi:3-oxoacyl-[acyl-carrier protein] reductase